MIDPTYDKAAIDKNLVWRIAFDLSELMNDYAPLGWSKYISSAEYLNKTYKIELKDEP